jgi:hypothetical protein
MDAAMPRHRHIRRVPDAWTALLAALLLLIQGLTPAAAMPRVEGGGVTIEICTHDGARSITVPQDHAPPTPHHDCCDHCVMAVAHALPAAAPALPVRYARSETAAPGAPVSPSALARAPPRPPSQGPPHLA